MEQTIVKQYFGKKTELFKQHSVAAAFTAFRTINRDLDWSVEIKTSLPGMNVIKGTGLKNKR